MGVSDTRTQAASSTDTRTARPRLSSHLRSWPQLSFCRCCCLSLPPDYFTPSYLYLWARDLPLLRAMGVNTLRIYSWNNEVDHTPFLDACEGFGLKVLVTHYVGSSQETPVNTADARQQAIDKFVSHVRLLGDHPAILAWSFGNELNGAWNGFMKDFSDLNGCKWSTDCYNNEDGPTSECGVAAGCVYKNLFGWLNDAAKAAKAVTTRPITSTFADVDHLINGKPATDKIPRMDSVMADFDFYAIQIYRGKTMQGYLDQYASETPKPLLVGEYGVDSFNDECGWQENFKTVQPCRNTFVTADQPGSKGGSKAGRADFVGCANTDVQECQAPGETTQSEWDVALTTEVLAHAHVMGGILMEWHDENWKNQGTQDFCKTPCPKGREAECADPSTELGKTYQMGGSAGCTYKAHVTCSNFDTTVHDLCGYYLTSAPDNYVNEAWFGLHGVQDCAISHADGSHRLSTIVRRPVVDAITKVFGGAGGSTEASCDGLKTCWQCAVYNTEADVSAGKCNAQCGMKLGSGTTTTPTTSTDGSTGAAAPPSSSAPSGVTSENPSQGTNDPNNTNGGGVSTPNANAASATIRGAMAAQLLAALAAVWALRF